MRRSKNIEPGLTPTHQNDSLESAWGEDVDVQDGFETPYGHLEFGCCDGDFIDNPVPETPSPRDEFFFPSAGEVASGRRLDLDDAIDTRWPPVDPRQGLEGEVGNDDRILVTNTQDPRYPWSPKICSLIVTTRHGRRLRGTGWLAGPKLVMTAAHNLFVHELGGWPATVTVVPGRNGNRAPFNHFTVRASQLIVTRGWKERKELTADFGGIVIPETYRVPFISQTGWFAIRNLDDARLRRARANVVGYPVRLQPVGSQWWHGRRILPDVDTHTFRYNVDTSRGQSGSPVFIYDGRNRFVVGIHHLDTGRVNQAVRINGPVLSRIRQWKRDAESVDA